jgi:hypothetical protein
MSFGEFAFIAIGTSLLIGTTYVLQVPAGCSSMIATRMMNLLSRLFCVGTNEPLLETILCCVCKVTFKLDMHSRTQAQDRKDASRITVIPTGLRHSDHQNKRNFSGLLGTSTHASLLGVLCSELGHNRMQTCTGFGGGYSPCTYIIVCNT